MSETDFRIIEDSLYVKGEYAGEVSYHVPDSQLLAQAEFLQIRPGDTWKLSSVSGQAGGDFYARNLPGVGLQFFFARRKP